MMPAFVEYVELGLSLQKPLEANLEGGASSKKAKSKLDPRVTAERGERGAG